MPRTKSQPLLAFALMGLVLLGCHKPTASPYQDSAMPGLLVKGTRYVDDEGKTHHVPDLYVDRTEVTVDAFRQCVRARGCSPDVGNGSSYIGQGRFLKENCNYSTRGRELHPMNCLGLAHAMQFCEWRGARLPTASEWEWIARAGAGPEGFPWGFESPSCERAIVSLSCNELQCFGCGRGSTWPVGSKPQGASRDGILDLAGNVGEYVLSDDGRRQFSIRGRSYVDHFVIGSELTTPAAFSPFAPEFPYSGGSTETGFRCVRDASP
ncbi:SUMF1/EgtB/PvdO family nonheme iron enzyme [Nannocystis sp. SCPEA4]|uniref:formylglycine-generating enzyme family protein n=1 Tax=Nannocystis sp. SCPEA4 TaxID=2996787 RepID=UPI00226DE27F|nr:SUMF1/EgtB/PvdO family nonheme iron enzyme [Nannocystis sp. SCPEA4]MCY1056211.1 SUMF1/EgtB/PvdO family nonheme iron enzyme [Nannocystis sp. SCPEA4]